ncbi:hypothetical protein D9Q98_002387 [Chlorella vulgaris]|uniref:Uncharacterized protein n=1 Tax=Chlorella vulgaris TaxID=3077 RepID=A0A9D4Z079_CHLVU|nr:hypothetical protein D9Q98_002387 [Chlorella vulgaris]
MTKAELNVEQARLMLQGIVFYLIMFIVIYLAADMLSSNEATTSESVMTFRNITRGLVAVTFGQLISNSNSYFVQRSILQADKEREQQGKADELKKSNRALVVELLKTLVIAAAIIAAALIMRHPAGQ